MGACVGPAAAFIANSLATAFIAKFLATCDAGTASRLDPVIISWFSATAGLCGDSVKSAIGARVNCAAVGRPPAALLIMRARATGMRVP
jgi:hypothetical protein